MPVLGYLERLDEQRLVFLGQSDDEPNTFYLAFRNIDGVDTKLKLSSEAFAALLRLRRKLTTSKEPKTDYPHGSMWHGRWIVSNVDWE